jgi:hypothetical protein
MDMKDDWADLMLQAEKEMLHGMHQKNSTKDNPPPSDAEIMAGKLRAEEERMRRQWIADDSIRKSFAVASGSSKVIAAPPVTKVVPDPGVAEKEAWLEKTQHMRVVALNEACEIAKTFIGHGELMETREITSMASLFAKFLVDDQA